MCVRRALSDRLRCRGTTRSDTKRKLKKERIGRKIRVVFYTQTLAISARLALNRAIITHYLSVIMSNRKKREE